MDNLEIIKSRFKEDRLARQLGIVLDDLTDTTVMMHMQLRDDMNNFFGRPHGGVIYSLADAAFSVLGNSQNNVSVAIQCSINYHASPDPGKILCVEGKTISTSRKTATYLFSVYTEEPGTRASVATMTGTLYRTGKPIDPAHAPQ